LAEARGATTTLARKVIPTDLSGYRPMGRKLLPINPIVDGSAFMYDAHGPGIKRIKANGQIHINSLIFKTFYGKKLKIHLFRPLSCGTCIGRHIFCTLLTPDEGFIISG
jgi:hypothetical protein